MFQVHEIIILQVLITSIRVMRYSIFPMAMYQQQSKVHAWFVEKLVSDNFSMAVETTWPSRYGSACPSIFWAEKSIADIFYITDRTP